MTTYVTGDRVRTRAESWGEDIVPLGATGTVVNPGTFISVAFDHDPNGDGTGVWAMREIELQHLGDTPTQQARLRETDGYATLILMALNGYTTNTQSAPHTTTR